MNFGALLILLLTCTACSSGDELAANLSAERSVAMMSALGTAGIPAERSKQTGGRNEQYRITVAKSDLSRAFQLINEYGLAHEGSEETLESVTSGSDFIPNMREVSMMRLDRGLSLEVERLLSALPGVVDVRAVIRANLIPNDSRDLPANTGKQDRSASIIVRYVSPSGNQPFSTDEVKRIVAESVPGLSAEQVLVTPTRVILSSAGYSGDSSSIQGVDGKGNSVQLVPVTPFPFSVPVQDKKRVLGLMGGLLVLFSLAGAIIGFSASSLFRKNRAAPRTVRSAVLEATYRPQSPSNPSLPSSRPGQPPAKGVPTKGDS